VTQLDIPDVEFIPLSALKGDNVVTITDRMPWYHGKSVLEFLETVHVSSDRNFEDLRYPVQYVNRPDRDFRGFAARVASGILRKGEKIMVLPSEKLRASNLSSLTTVNWKKPSRPSQSP
jgi:bifunctional enzyme CysN/CysC